MQSLCFPGPLTAFENRFSLEKQSVVNDAWPISSVRTLSGTRPFRDGNSKISSKPMDQLWSRTEIFHDEQMQIEVYSAPRL